MKLFKNNKNLNFVITGLAIFVGAALLIPLLFPASATSSEGYVNFVNFWITIRDHLSIYWMFYAIILALLKFMPKKVSRKSPLNKKQLQWIFGLVVAFVLASLFIPVMFPLDGLAADASQGWVNTVTFLTDSGNHIQTYWMFYTVIAAILWFRPGKK